MNQVRHNYFDLFLLVAMYLVVALSIHFNITIIRIVFGTFCIFYAPGYALFAALYPDTEGLNQGQRYAGSVGLSVVVTGLLQLIVTFSVGTTLITSFGVLVIWGVVMVLIAAYRRSLLPPENRFWVELDFQFADWIGETQLGKGLAVAEGIAIILLILAAGRLLWVSIETRPQYTEFY